MNTKSNKAKGRRLQVWARDQLINELGINSEDVKSRTMGESGTDLILSSVAHRLFPFSVECKNTERLSLWAAWAQAQANKEDYEPLLIAKRNHHSPLAILDAEYFFKMQGRINE